MLYRYLPSLSVIETSADVAIPRVTPKGTESSKIETRNVSVSSISSSLIMYTSNRALVCPAANLTLIYWFRGIT